MADTAAGVWAEIDASWARHDRRRTWCCRVVHVVIFGFAITCGVANRAWPLIGMFGAPVVAALFTEWSGSRCKSEREVLKKRLKACPDF